MCLHGVDQVLLKWCGVVKTFHSDGSYALVSKRQGANCAVMSGTTAVIHCLIKAYPIVLLVDPLTEDH